MVVRSTRTSKVSTAEEIGPAGGQRRVTKIENYTEQLIRGLSWLVRKRNTDTPL
jgi:hypothetical protein